MLFNLKRITSLILSLSILFAFTSCFAEESEFPVINFPSSNGSVEESINDSSSVINDSFHEITVALPLSDETVNYLMKLYYAKSNGLFPDNQSGLDISLEYLGAMSTPWVVNTITTTGEGESYDAIASMIEYSSVPDLFLTSDIVDLATDGIVIPLDSYLSDNEFISSSIFLGTLEPLLLDNSYYGLPFYSSVLMIAGNKDFCPDEGIPPFSMTSEELRSFVNSIPDINDGVIVYNPESFNTYLGAGYFNNSQINTSDYRLSRSCGIWLMNSGEFETWNSYYPDGLYFTMLPTENVYATVYPVCVSSSSSEAEFSADFASFICFDRDAQMLINRLEVQRGYFPVISSPAVWEIISSDSEFGSQAMLYEQFMSSAIYSLPEDT